MFATDFGNNGDYDLVVTNYDSDYVSVLINSDDCTFNVPIDYLTGDGPFPVCFVDLDGDCDLDLAIANTNSNDVDCAFPAYPQLSDISLMRPLRYAYFSTR